MKLIMTGLDHKRAELDVREKFALTKDRTAKVLEAITGRDGVGGCVIISTCNRTELYACVCDKGAFEPTKALCEAAGRDYSEFKSYFDEREGKQALGHLCRVASGMDSLIMGDDQIITQVREALEFSRAQNCTDSYTETVFKIAVQAAKVIKHNIILKSSGIDSVPGKAVEKLKAMRPLTGLNVVVIGNGQIGRLVSKLLIDEGAIVTITLREYKKGVLKIPDHARTIRYSERYEAVGQAAVVVSATTSPHYTLFGEEMKRLARLPEVIVDLAVPRDVEPSIGDLPGVLLLTIDDISGESRALPQESLSRIESVIAEHIGKYDNWNAFKQEIEAARAGGVA